MGVVNKSVLALLFLLIIQKESDAARILGVFPISSRSHFTVCEALMKGLVMKGHRVDVVSPFPQKEPLHNYNDISIAEWVPNTVNNLTLKNVEIYTISNMKKIIELAGTSLCYLLEIPQVRNIIKNPPTDPPYDVVINELVAAECFLAFGRYLKVPVVGVVTSKLFDWMNTPLTNPASSAFVPSIFSKFNQRMNFFERLENTVVSGYARMIYSTAVSSQLQFVEKSFGLKLSSTTELYNDVAVMLVNTHPSFDFVRPMTPGIVEVGGLHVSNGSMDMSPEVLKWLANSKNGCIYFSFGSMVKIESFPTKTIKAFYETFERISPVRVLFKIANSSELPPGLPKNVMIAPWFPQTRVLQHKNIKAFVTHGGTISVIEALTYGVPMISVPIYSDQHINAHLSEQHNIGIAVDYREITADSFTKAVNDVLTNTKYRENSKRLANLFVDRPMSAMDTATFWIEYVIRNGKVLRTPIDELSWWQLESLDVYVFLIMGVLLAIYIVKIMLELAFSYIRSHFLPKIGRRCTKPAVKSKKN